MKPVEDSDLHCEACGLIEDKQHRFAELLGALGDREKAYYGAGYTAKAWAPLVCRLLSNENTWASFWHHRRGFSSKTRDWGEELRRLERVSSEANVYDLFVSQNPDSEAWKHLEKIYTQGVETKGEEGPTYRRPTRAELKLAVQAVVSLRPKEPHEMTLDQQMQAETITIDTRGKMVAGTGRGAARKRSADLHGFAPERLVVEVAYKQSQDALMLSLEKECARVLRLVEDSQEQFALGVAGASLLRDVHAFFLTPGSSVGPDLTERTETFLANYDHRKPNLDDLKVAVRGLEVAVLGGVG